MSLLAELQYKILVQIFIEARLYICVNLQAVISIDSSSVKEIPLTEILGKMNS
jgi:hypothetical protein